MNKIFLILLMSIFVLGGINAAGLAQICIDKDPPSLLNSSLTLTATNNNINLNWIAATDIPDCSGIDYYDIWESTDGINFLSIAHTSDTTYTDASLSYGNTYYYMIDVFDLAGHNEGEEALSNSLYLSPPSVPPPSGGGGGGSRTSFWECGEWSECINETQERTCEDINRLQTDRIETKECIPEFVPTGQESEENETITSTTATPGFFAGITGAVIGALGTGGTIMVAVFVLILIVGSIVVLKVRKMGY